MKNPPAKNIYRRLTGRKRTFAGFSQLWLAPDHILLVRSNRFVEHYHRFALADIQAITVTALPERMPLQIVAAAAAILWTLVFLVVGPMFEKIFFVSTGVIAMAMVFADIARGQRCVCYVQTAVSKTLLPPVSRLRQAHEFLEKLTPAIEAVQGPLPAERAAEVDQPAQAAPVVPGAPDVPHRPTYLPELLFALFLVNALVVLADLRWPHHEIAASLLPTTMLGEAGILAVALIRRQRDTRRFIYLLMIAAIFPLAWDFVMLVRNFGGVIVAAMDAGRRRMPVPAFDPSGFWEQNLLSAAWRSIIGVAGLIAARWERSASSASHPPFPASEAQQ